MMPANEVSRKGIRDFRIDSLRQAWFEVGKNMGRCHSWFFMLAIATGVLAYLGRGEPSADPLSYGIHRLRALEVLLLATALQYYRFMTFMVYASCLQKKLRLLLAAAGDPHWPWYASYPSFSFVQDEVAPHLSKLWGKLVHGPAISMIVGLLFPIALLVYVGYNSGFRAEWYFMLAALLYVDLASLVAVSSAGTTKAVAQIESDFGTQPTR